MSRLVPRRTFLTAMGATVIAAGGLNASRGQTQQAAPWSAGTEAPKLKAPPDACDCHMHIYASRFLVAPSPSMPSISEPAAPPRSVPDQGIPRPVIGLYRRRQDGGGRRR